MMLTTDEIESVHDLIDRVRETREAIEEWAAYCEQRKLNSHTDRSWDARVGAVNNAVADVRSAERRITESFS